MYFLWIDTLFDLRALLKLPYDTLPYLEEIKSLTVIKHNSHYLFWFLVYSLTPFEIYILLKPQFPDQLCSCLRKVLEKGGLEISSE